ncbi:hypothetical protein NDU88_005138 [Pleurodeles waltl]|uniref:Uncharacterized protein n=1 Tax=Pleurodeles waltl TaxID=8319 RepID=A0AAV7SKU5_PLEWA|nr:hypothetical protein NDU88_005138 [Pleurodeles waltl]
MAGTANGLLPITVVQHRATTPREESSQSQTRKPKAGTEAQALVTNVLNTERRTVGRDPHIGLAPPNVVV